MAGAVDALCETATLNRASVLTRASRCRPTTLDPYLPFVRDTLA